MPEIRNEVPSDDELREYFELSAKENLLHLLVAEESTCAAVIGARHAAAATTVRTIAGDEFYRRAYYSVLANLRRLNQLPRTHPFWTNTNLRPTYPKLAEYCEMLLAADPVDEIALWFLGTHEAHAGDRFGQDYWLRLHRLGKFPLSWAPCPAYWACGGSVDFHYQFADFFDAAAPDANIAELLRPYIESGNTLVVEWAIAVLSAWYALHP